MKVPINLSLYCNKLLYKDKSFCRDNSLFANKSIVLRRSLALFFLLAISSCLTTKLYAQQVEPLYVQVKLTKLRMEPKQWGLAIRDLVYGQSLTVLDEQGAWLKVKLESSEQGFIHTSAVSGRKILIGATAQAILTSSADDPDVYLAGKGFSELTVGEYQKNLRADANTLKKMKGLSELGEKELHNFLLKGKLKDA